ncbi:MAG: glycosyltransferase family 4 protein [Ferruginibacter sp.]|nr:glycosyltransferase family 4 protein [Ferruginibacter sp.]
MTSFFRHKVYYSHVLVAGMRQFEYAKRLGFENNKVLWPLYSADNRLFNQIPLNKKRFDFPRDILFVGRFAEVKGIETLLKAWGLLLDKKAATLTLVGNGPLKDKLAFPADVRVLDFTTQEELAQLAYKSTCFVLPSVFEPWALVLHEFAAAGLPMIATSACGATTQFLINNYNGFVIEPNDVNGLASALQKILQMDAEILYTFSKRSRELSQAISPDLVANAILSVIK